MRVAVRCGDPVVAGSVATVVSAAGGAVRACPDHADLVTALWSVDAVVLDVNAAELLDREGGVGSPSTVVVFDDSAPGRAAWTVGSSLRAVGVVGLPSGEPMLLEALLAAPARSRTGGRVVGVLGSGGGAGASSLAVMLAAVAARDGRSVALIDTDQRGGGLDLLLGAEAQPGPRWPELLAATGSVAAALAGPVRVDGVTLVSSGRALPGSALPPRMLGEVLDCLRGGHELVVVDVGRPEIDAVAAACDTVLVICARQVRSAAAATVLASQLGAIADRRLVATGPGAPDLSADDVAGAVGIPLAAVLPHDRSVAKAAARGELQRLPRRNRTMRAVRRLLADLGPVPSGAGDSAGAGPEDWPRVRR